MEDHIYIYTHKKRQVLAAATLSFIHFCNHQATLCNIFARPVIVSSTQNIFKKAEAKYSKNKIKLAN